MNQNSHSWLDSLFFLLPHIGPFLDPDVALCRRLQEYQQGRNILTNPRPPGVGNHGAIIMRMMLPRASAASSSGPTGTLHKRAEATVSDLAQPSWYQKRQQANKH